MTKRKHFKRRLILLISLIVVGVLFFYFPNYPFMDFVKDHPSEPLAPDTLPIQTKTQSPPKTEQMVLKKIQTLFNKLEYEKALKLINKHLKNFSTSQSTRNWLNTQKPMVQSALAWQFIQNKDWNLALYYLDKANRLSPTRETEFGLAYVYFQKKQWQESERHLGWLEAHHKMDSQACHLYIRLLEKQQQYNLALEKIETYQRLLAQDNPHELATLKKRLELKSSSQAEKSFIESANFSLSFHGIDHQNISEVLLEKAEESLFFFISQYGFTEPIVQIPIILYETSQLSHKNENLPLWADGMFDGAIHLPINSQWPDPQKIKIIFPVLSHEIIHALFDQEVLSREIPTWIHEGMAQNLTCKKHRCSQEKSYLNLGEFLDEEFFLTQFQDLKSIKAKKLYTQSLHMINTIEDLKGPESLRVLVSSMANLTKTSSNDWLNPLDLSFRLLYDESKSRWDQAKTSSPLETH